MFLAEIERKSNELKEKILGMPDGELFSGTVYYVSADGEENFPADVGGERRNN